jgi:hypothetical protein
MNEIEIVKYFNVVLLSEKDDKFFNIHECLVPKHLKYETKYEKEYLDELEGKITEFSKSRKYFNQFKNGSFELMPKGEKAKRKGGHFELEKYENNKEDKQDELLDLDLKLRRFESKIDSKIKIAGFIILFLSFLITVFTMKIFNNNENTKEDNTKKVHQVIDQKSNKDKEILKDTLKSEKSEN